MGFGRRVLLGQAIAGGRCRVEKSLHTIGARRLQAANRPIDIRAVIVKLRFNGWHDIADSGDMEKPVDTAHCRLNGVKVANIGADKFKSLLITQMRDFLRPTGGKIIHPDNAMPFGN